MRTTPAFQFKADKVSGDGTFRGYASVFNGPPDSYGDIVMPGAFARSLAEFKATGTAPAMLWAHDMAQPIGVYTELVEDDTGLAAAGKLTLETAQAREAFALLRDGAVSGLSVGFLVPANGAVYTGSSRVLTDVDLKEISLVAIPANSRARVTEVKSLDPRAIEDLLRSSGLSKSHARALMAHGMKGLNSSPDADEIAALVGSVKTATAKLKGLR